MYSFSDILRFKFTDNIWLRILQRRLREQGNSSDFGFLDLLERDCAGHGCSLASVLVVVPAQALEFCKTPLSFSFETGELCDPFLIFNYVLNYYAVFTRVIGEGARGAGRVDRFHTENVTGN